MLVTTINFAWNHIFNFNFNSFLEGNTQSMAFIKNKWKNQFGSNARIQLSHWKMRCLGKTLNTFHPVSQQLISTGRMQLTLKIIWHHYNVYLWLILSSINLCDLLLKLSKLVASLYGSEFCNVTVECIKRYYLLSNPDLPHLSLLVTPGSYYK